MLSGEDWVESFISSIINAEQSKTYPYIDGAVATTIDRISKEKLIYLPVSHIAPEPPILLYLFFYQNLV